MPPIRKQNKPSSINKSAKTTGIPAKILRIPLLTYLIVLILPLITCYIFFNYAFEKNGVMSFTLDDPWIHLTFARNLADYFSFSYYQAEMVTAGSTSPLYTLILAACMLIYKNEMILSYVLGAVFFSAASFFFFKISMMEFSDKVYLSLMVTLIFIFDKWMNFISMSGMETILFILILIAAAFSYKGRKPVLLGILLGLTIWARPDGIAFVFAVFVTYLIERYWFRLKPGVEIFGRKDLIKIILCFFILTALYVILNLVLSGTFVPNTYFAKVAFYIDNAKRLTFLKETIWGFFTKDYYSILMPGFIISVAAFIYSLYKRSYNGNAVYLLFIFLFIIQYTIKFAVINRFGRYMMPAVPFFILTSMYGYYVIILFLISKFRSKLIGTAAYSILFLVTFYYCYQSFEKSKVEYAKWCKHTYDRHIKTAYWLRDKTKESDVIATHDIGAIGFYSGRRIVDVGGLVTPELAEKLNESDYVPFMEEYLKAHNVSYVAFLDEWYTIMNQRPLVMYPESAGYENLLVFKFVPGETKILNGQAHRYMMQLATNVSEKKYDEFISNLNKAIELEPTFGYAYYIRANYYQSRNDFENYEKDMLRCIELYPDFDLAHFSIATFLFNNNRFADANVHIRKALEISPSNNEYKTLSKKITDSLNSGK